jgi:hypothetical protein
MSNGHIVYSNGNLTTEDGEISIMQHTSEVYIANFDKSNWIEVKLNGGPHSVWVPPAPTDGHTYMKVPGDYVKLQVITANSAVRVYAVG